ncbi:uncharacterized protein LOC115976666 [Quercus lobata]|uniref:uncharacterized protein LOC115962866 n=1 Tax=Quercus lobata TaxID=97700 RepID=UPI0012440892|nr:uncharacterized protein LOC115962866 [Quercus lobata]XP_030938983.1 uncharacterized protein LOC115963872 [Quercus lobata]XP_030953611.1 uncharacterized protein LOC115976459 [Quercus lobata]XP_030953968.1 uncharacterized protein LOC115976666 [Quercus lobata]
MGANDFNLRPNLHIRAFSLERQNLKQQHKVKTAEPLLLTKPNPAPLLSKLLTKRRTSSLSQTQIQAILQKACKGTTMGANDFNLRPNLHIRAFSLGFVGDSIEEPPNLQNLTTILQI